jgi:hypothetical protein
MNALLVLCLAAPPAAPVTAVAYSPDGRTLVAGTRGEVTEIDAATGDPLAVHKTLNGRVTAVTWASNSRYAVAAGEPGLSGVVRVYDLRSTRPVATWNAHGDTVFALAFTPDGKTLATAGYDRVIKLWTVGGDTSKPAAELKDHSDAVYALTVSPDGTLLASAGADRSVKIWDVKTGTRRYTLGDNTDWVYAASWSPDGKRLAAAGVDKSLRSWAADRVGGILERSAFAHAGPVVKLVFTADGKSIVTAGEDRVVKVWDAATLKETATHTAQPDSILALAVSPKGDRVAVGRFDGTLAVVETKTGKTLQTLLPARPKLTAASPKFLPRGRTTTVTFTGSGLDSATRLACPGLSINGKIGATETTVVAEVTVPLSHPLGPVGIFASGPFGTSAPVSLDVERFPSVTESGGTDSLAAAMTVPVDRVLAGTLDRAGDVDYFRFAAKAGQPVGVAAEAKFTPVLTLSGPDGTVLIESSAGSLGVVCPSDGTYGLAIRDRDYRGGAAMTYRMSVGAVPVVTGVFPPAVKSGTTTKVIVSGVHLTPGDSSQTLSLTVAADETRKSIDLSSRIGTSDPPVGTAAVAVESIAAVVANGAEVRFDSLPGAADGVIISPGSSLTARFLAKAGDRLVVEGLARRYGSPVDPSIEILDADGKPVPRATLRCVAKTFLTFRDHDAAKPGLRLETWNELAANDLLLIDNELVKIQQLPGHPDSDCDFFNVGGKRSSFLDTTNAHHALNSPMYKVEVHPAGATPPANGMPVFRLDYRNDDGGPGYGKDARLFFTAPADGSYRVRLTDARGFGGPTHVARVVVRPPEPAVAVTFSPTVPKAWKGGTIPVTVNVERIDGYDGPLRVELADLPKGFTSAPGRVGAGFHTTTLGLVAIPDATSSDTPLSLVARYEVNGMTRTVRVAGKPLAVTDPGEIVTTTKSSSLAIRPGHETRFVVSVERRHGFAGRIPIDVRGLPHGVTVQNIGLNKIMITEKETEREVVLRAEPWVEPTTVPLVVVAIREGKAAESAAKPLPLTVAP